jgi:hypothetical protein
MRKVKVPHVFLGTQGFSARRVSRHAGFLGTQGGTLLKTLSGSPLPAVSWEVPYAVADRTVAAWLLLDTILRVYSFIIVGGMASASEGRSTRRSVHSHKLSESTIRLWHSWRGVGVWPA